PESAHDADQGVRAAELVQVNLLFGQAVNLGLGACEAVDGIEGLRLDRIRRVRLLDDFAQRRHGSLDAVAHADQHAGARRVAAGSDSSSFFDSPSMTSRAAARTCV